MLRNSTAIVASIAALAAAGCSTAHDPRPADKAGGAQGTTVLRLATVDGPEEPSLSVVRWFAARVAALSHGRLRVRLVYDVGSSRADREQQVVRSVRRGRNELGWIGSGGWDEVGVRSFQALHIPFLITSNALADAVAEGRIARSMLKGTRRAGVVGVALVPGPLRHPAAKQRPLRAPRDFRGVRLLADRSRATDGVLHAYGAVAVHGALGVPHDGELGTFAEPGVGVGWMTGNVVVDPGFKVLFANPGTVADLDDTQLAALREAARALVGESERRTPSEQRAAIAACRRSGVAIATASRRDRAALMRAAQPAEAALERDATTKKRVAQIAALARRMRLPALSVPRACAERARSARRPTPRPSNLLDGTYHVLYTRADARAFGLPPSDPHSLATLPAVDTRILEDGRWYDMSEDTTPFATYTILGNRLTVSMPQFDSVETFTFRRDGDTLYLKPVLPMERGDQFVLAGEPWHRVGPPIRAR